MMWGYGPGWIWMLLMPLLAIALIVLVVWAVRLGGRPGEGERGRRGQQTPREILDRRFASGEIDADTYAQARDKLAGGGSQSS
jgi:putative membrane protein